MIGYFNTYLKKYWQSQRQKSYTSLGLSLALILLFSVFALRPTLLTVIELREKLAQGKQANTQLDQKIQSLSQAQINYEKIKNSLPLLDEALPNSSKILDFLNQVNSTARQNELLVVKAQSQAVPLALGAQTKDETQPSKKEQPISFTFEAKGSYENTRKFLTNLQSFVRLVDLNEVSISKEKDEQDLKLSVEGTVYYLP